MSVYLVYEEFVVETGAAAAEVDDVGDVTTSDPDPNVFRTFAISSVSTCNATAENSFFTGSITNFYATA